MKKVIGIALIIVFAPMIFAASNSVSAKGNVYNPNAKTSEGSPSIIVQPAGDRAFGDILMDIDLTAIGMPGDGYDNAGITSDGQYVYLVSMYDNRCYVIDPTGPSIVTSWAAPAGMSWGVGHEANMWITEYNAKYYHEYTFAGTPTGASFYALPGGAVWMGDVAEWWADGEIWGVAVGGSNKAYKFLIPSGTLVDSVGNATWTYISQRGWTYDPWNMKFFVGGWNSNTVWELNLDGSPTGRQFAFASIASLSYDYMPTVHPAPVLWLASNAAANHLYMIDAANPVPSDTVVWDFETGWQGWTHTSAYTFPRAWDVQVWNYNADGQSPNPGDSSMWIDSDEAGSVTVSDTAWSPWVIPTSNTHWFKWGFGFIYYSGSDFMTVGLRACVGGVWQAPVQLRMYQGADYNALWDSVDVSSYQSADYVQLFFYYYGYYDWYASFDNVFINGIIYVPEHDVAPVSINVPAIVPENTVINPQATVRNMGSYNETFDVTCTINPGGYSSTFNVVDLAPGTNVDVTFTDPFTFGSGFYTVTVFTQLVGDGNPGNDTTSTTVEATNWLYYDDGVSANAWAFYYLDNGFGVQFPVGLEWWVDSIAAYFYDASWPSPGGTSASFRIYDGASQPTNIRWELAGQTIVRGDWNKFATDTTLTHFLPGDNVFYFYIQNADYPNCPGLSIDASCEHAGYLWYLDTGTFYNGDYFGGDWLLRVHIVTMTGVSEWVDVNPDALKLNAATVTNGNAKIEFTIPTTAKTTLTVYDASGRLCKTLVSEKLTAGTHTINVNYDLPSGTYFYNLKSGSGVNLTQKFLLVR